MLSNPVRRCGSGHMFNAKIFTAIVEGSLLVKHRKFSNMPFPNVSALIRCDIQILVSVYPGAN